MRFLTLFITLIVINISWGQKKSDCLAFQTGDYYTINGSDTCYINRTKDRQFEYCQSSAETKIKLIVIWLKDCKYILRDIQYNPSTKPFTMRNDIVMTIIETKEDSYIVHAKKKGQPKLTTTVYRVK